MKKEKKKVNGPIERGKNNPPKGIELMEYMGIVNMDEESLK